MKEIRIAIVGAGYMAHEHARVFADLPNVRIVGVAGRNRQRAQALAELYAAKVYDDIACMYAETQATAVIVAVNEPAMLSVCLQVFAFPWLCLLEKPVGIDLAEARVILEDAHANRANAYVALNRRSYSATLGALSHLKHDTGPRLISVLDQQDLVAVKTSGQPESVVRNYMFANSIHLIDYFTLFGRGEVRDVRHIVHWTPQSPSHVVASIHFSSGDIGVYQAVWNGPGPWSVTITDSAVRAELRPLEKLSIQRRSERKLIEILVDPVDTQFKPGLHRQAREFCRAIRGETSDLCDIATSFRSMELCAHIYGVSAEAAVL